MKRLAAILVLFMPVIGIAETISITVTGPSQQLNVTKQSVIVQPQSVTENVVIDSTGTRVVTVTVPGPQGAPGSGADAALRSEFQNYTSTHSGQAGGTIDPAVLDGKYDKTAFANYSRARQTQFSTARVRLDNYSTHVAATYLPSGMLTAHNTASSSHNGHFVAANPHTDSASRIHFTNMSTHWFKANTTSDPLKLDVTVHNDFVQATYSSIAKKLDTSVFQEYGTLNDAALANKLAVQRFLNYSALGRGGPMGPTGYDGVNAIGVTCSVIPSPSAQTSIIYDKDGFNPSVSTLGPFVAYLYEGSAVLMPKEYTWYMPAILTQLVYPVSEPGGLQLKRSYFEPRVFGTFSANRTANYVKVQMRYSASTTTYNGVCEASYPITVTKLGPQGQQGAQGPSGAATRAAVQKLFSSASYQSNVPMTFRPLDNYTSSYQIIMRDAQGNARMGLNGLGYQKFMDANGFMVREMGLNGTMSLLQNNVKRLDLKPDGSVTVYRNGIPVYEIYSTGRWKGKEGYGPTASKIFPFVRPDGYRGYTSITVNPVTASSGATVTRFLAYSTYHTVGRKFGNYSSMKSINGRYLGSTETVANPAFSFEVLFKGVTDFNKIELMEQYSGSAAHSVDIQIYNYLSGTWFTLETITNQTSLMSKLYTIMTATPYISGTNARLKFSHNTTGTASHVMLIDYVSLTKDTGAGMPTDPQKSFQYNRGGSFGGAAQMQYSSVSATKGRVILPVGVSNIEYVNSRRSLIFSICSSVRLVIGGGC